MFLFVLLSGYVYKSKGSIGPDIRNKFRQLIVPYLKFAVFFTVTYFVRYVLLSDMTPALFLQNTLGNFLANPNLNIPALGSGANEMRYAFVPYWYIAELFMAYILFIAVNRAIEKKGIYARAAAAVILLGLAALTMRLDVRGLLKNTFASEASYFTVVPNIIGFAALLLFGTIWRCFNLYDLDAHSGRFNVILFIVCLAHLCVRIALYDNQYALQYGKWGQYGLWSVRITTITGFTLTYCLIFIAHYLKRIGFLKTALTFIGARTLDILLLHFGIGELWCMILGCWHSVYQVEYPAEGFAWRNFILVAALTAASIAVFIYAKEKRKKSGGRI